MPPNHLENSEAVPATVIPFIVLLTNLLATAPAHNLCAEWEGWAIGKARRPANQFYFVRNFRELKFHEDYLMTQFYIRFSAALLCSILFLVSNNSYGQTVADTLELEEIEVTATRIRQPLKLQPVDINVIDSTRLSFLRDKDIGNVLAMESNLFVKNNGPGLFSNASQRGLSPEQIQVLWEGIPINHSMLGLSDLSLLPSSFFSSVQVSSGVPSSSFGGGLSGGLYLNSDFKNSNQISLSQSAGSFGRYHSGLQAAVRQGNWNVSLRSKYSDADNDYKYFNRAFQRVEERDHNHHQQKHVMASAGYKKNGNRFDTKLWFSDSDNQIPGSILKTDSRSWQDDQAFRWLSSYETRVGAVDVTAKNYLDRVVLDYYDSEIDVESRSTTRQWLLSTELQYQPSAAAKIKGEISGGITGVETNNFSELKIRNRFSALVNPEFSLFDYRLKIYPALRFDSYSDFGNILSPSLGLNYELFYDKIYLRGQLSHDFNPPTFNALYWPQGGNPNLEPERSKSAEAGLVATFDNEFLNQVTIMGFYNRVHDGIRWYPDNTGTYSPSNIQEVSSKGVELSTESRYNLQSEIQFFFKQSGSLMRIEITEPRFEGDAGVDNQMRYVPQWMYKSSLQATRGFISALIHYRWVGRRYITDTEDITNSLDPYHKVDAALQAQQNWWGLTFTGNLQINNLLNADYEVIQWYAMPRRNFQFTLTATYNF